MAGTYFEDQTFESIDFSSKPLILGEYEGCSFINCNFSNTDLSEIQFIDCQFKSCNLSMVKTIKTSFNGVDPEINRIRKAKFSLPGIAGLLDKYNIEIG